jgi:predicted dienelactone hydrolase
MLPPDLLYPSQGLVDVEHREVQFLDPARVGQPDRPIPAAIRWSPSATQPMPFVVLSHGGAFGHVNPGGALDEWATMLSRHGYMSVAIAHTPRTDLERIVLTMNLGGTLPQCREFKYLNYDRPLDFMRVVSELVDPNAVAPWSGLIDASAMAYLGHSSGSGSAMMIAGAGREYMPGLGLAFAEHRGPKAFVALSPEGAGDDGFQADSWDTVQRPVLMCTGASDGDHPHERRDPYEYMQPGDKYLLWIEHEGAQHTVFEGDTRACAEVTDQSTCDDMQAWLGSGIRAFLDAYVLNDGDAIDYLATDSLVQASAGFVEWDSK